MHVPWIFLLLFAAPFWESKPAADWTHAELARFLSDSPWAQAAAYDSRIGGASQVRILLATARPIQDAEQQMRLRRARRPEAPLGIDQDYRDFLAANTATAVVVAVSGATLEGMSNADDTRLMEKECVMKVGRRKYRITGHFPPSSGDPYLRLIFPRVAVDSEKEVVFEVYVPGAVPPYREAAFRIRDLYWKGKLEM